MAELVDTAQGNPAVKRMDAQGPILELGPTDHGLGGRGARKRAYRT